MTASVPLPAYAIGKTARMRPARFSRSARLQPGRVASTSWTWPAVRWTNPSSPRSVITDPSTLKSRAQLSRMASNTGCASSTDRLITCSTAADAVCCSSASRVSLIRRAFFIAICACVAKAWTSAISCGANGFTASRTSANTPTSVSPSNSGTSRSVRTAPRSTLATMKGWPSRYSDVSFKSSTCRNGVRSGSSPSRKATGNDAPATNSK